ncbi:hypothetical protein Tco_1411868, partial [Tanacetum coccineum]
MTLINAEGLSNFVSLQCLIFFVNALLQNTMAERNVPTQPLQDTVMSSSVTALANGSCNLPAYSYGTLMDKTNVKALAITPVIPAQPFELPPSGNTVIDFVNELGYPEPVEIVSNIRVNYVYQPWRSILTLINQAVMGRIYSRDPYIFLTQSKSQSQSEVPKEESNSSPYSLIDLSKKKRTTDQFILVRRDQTPHESTTRPSSQPEDDTSEKVIHESSSTSDSERTESETETVAPKGDKEQGEVDSFIVTSGASIPVSVPDKAHEALAGPDPEPMQEYQTGSNSRKLHVSLAGPNPEHMDDEFL